MTLATNHLSYFTLALSLLPLLIKADTARIVNVASTSHFSGKIDFDSFMNKKNYFILKAYAQSKLCNILFTKYLDKQLEKTSITVNALCPGRVRTKIGNKSKGLLHQLGWSIVVWFSGVSIKKGAATHVFLATHDNAANYSGSYFKP